IRCTEMQLWPANENAFAASFSAARSRSASAATTTGVALPSSRFTRFFGARSATPQPTAPEPVNVIALTRSSSISTSPISAAGPTTTLSHPAGKPASSASSARKSADSGVWLAGFSTTAHPAASAGASLPSPACAASIGTISPASLRASTAANVYVDIARDTSTRAVLSGFPASAQVLNGLLARQQLEPGEIEDVQLGCVTQIGEQGWNLGRMVPLVAGWPETVCGTTVDRQCGSSMQTNMNAAAVSRLGLEPRARFVSFGLAGVDPYRMLHGNPQACAKALARAGLTWDDVSVIEVNEAFASVVLQFARDAGLEDRWDDINPNGGGISLGHPLGATGARITATLLNELERRDARYGIATMCIGFGQAIACVIERL